MENVYSTAVEIANMVCREQFWQQYKEKNPLYDLSEDPMRLKERKERLWGKFFGKGFTQDPDVPLEIKQLHKQIFLSANTVLSKPKDQNSTDKFTEEMEKRRIHDEGVYDDE